MDDRCQAFGQDGRWCNLKVFLTKMKYFSPQIYILISYSKSIYNDVVCYVANTLHSVIFAFKAAGLSGIDVIPHFSAFRFLFSKNLRLCRRDLEKCQHRLVKETLLLTVFWDFRDQMSTQRL